MSQFTRLVTGLYLVVATVLILLYIIFVFNKAASTTFVVNTYKDGAPGLRAA